MWQKKSVKATNFHITFYLRSCSLEMLGIKTGTFCSQRICCLCELWQKRPSRNNVAVSASSGESLGCKKTLSRITSQSRLNQEGLIFLPPPLLQLVPQPSETNSRGVGESKKILLWGQSSETDSTPMLCFFCFLKSKATPHPQNPQKAWVSLQGASWNI